MKYNKNEIELWQAVAVLKITNPRGITIQRARHSVAVAKLKGRKTANKAQYLRMRPTSVWIVVIHILEYFLIHYGEGEKVNIKFWQLKKHYLTLVYIMTQIADMFGASEAEEKGQKIG